MLQYKHICNTVAIMFIHTLRSINHRIQKVSSDSNKLNNIRNDECNLVVWERSLSLPILEYVNELLYSTKFRSIMIPSDEQEKLYYNLPITSSEGRTPFIEDLLQLLWLYKEATGQHNPKIHLTTILAMQCPLFHVDFNQVRLLCTYHGPGTLWLEEPNTDRSHLGCGHNDHVVKDWDQIRQTNTGDVALLKGERYPGNMGYGIVHKSPEVPKETKRLFLRIEC
jgi:hypothetical protein